MPSLTGPKSSTPRSNTVRTLVFWFLATRESIVWSYSVRNVNDAICKNWVAYIILLMLDCNSKKETHIWKYYEKCESVYSTCTYTFLTVSRHWTTKYVHTLYSKGHHSTNTSGWTETGDSTLVDPSCLIISLSFYLFMWLTLALMCLHQPIQPA